VNTVQVTLNYCQTVIIMRMLIYRYGIYEIPDFSFWSANTMDNGVTDAIHIYIYCLWVRHVTDFIWVWCCMWHYYEGLMGH